MRRTGLGNRFFVITSNLKFTSSHVVREHRTTRIPLLLLALLSFHLERLLLYVFVLFLCDCVPCLYGLSALTPCSHQGSEMLNERDEQAQERDWWVILTKARINTLKRGSEIDLPDHKETLRPPPDMLIERQRDLWTVQTRSPAISIIFNQKKFSCTWKHTSYEIKRPFKLTRINGKQIVMFYNRRQC